MTLGGKPARNQRPQPAMPWRGILPMTGVAGGANSPHRLQVGAQRPCHLRIPTGGTPPPRGF